MYVCMYVCMYRRPKKGSQKACSIHARPLWASLCTYSVWASMGLSGPLCASMCLSEALWASLGLSGPLWDFPGLSGPLWAYLKDSWSPKGAQGPQVARQKPHNTRQLEPQCPSRPEIARQKDQTIPDSWSPSVPRGPKLPDKKTRQYPTAGAPVSFEALWASASQPASPPASQPSA